MYVRIVELVFHLPPHVIEYIVALFCRTQVELRPERDVAHLVSGSLYFLHLTSGAQIQVLAFLVLNHASASYALYYELC